MTNLESLDAITIDDLEIDCIIGVYPEERETPQTLRLKAQLFLGLAPAAQSERLSDTVDYQLVVQQLAFLLKYGQFHLLETAAHVLCRTLLLPPTDGEHRAAIDAVRLTIDKPLALSKRATPSLTITRLAKDCRVTTEEKPFGTVDTIHETEHAGFYRLNVAPGLCISPHVHQHMREAEQVLSSGLLCQNQHARAGSVRSWPMAVVHRYDNPSPLTQSLLCIDRPPFIESDEIPSAGPVEPWTPASVWDS